MATFQLSSAASLNLGWSQNVVLGNGLMTTILAKNTTDFCNRLPHNDYFRSVDFVITETNSCHQQTWCCVLFICGFPNDKF